MKKHCEIPCMLYFWKYRIVSCIGISTLCRNRKIWIGGWFFHFHTNVAQDTLEEEKDKKYFGFYSSEIFLLSVNINADLQFKSLNYNLNYSDIWTNSFSNQVWVHRQRRDSHIWNKQKLKLYLNIWSQNILFFTMNIPFIKTGYKKFPSSQKLLVRPRPRLLSRS